MAGFEVLVRPMILPNIRPAPRPAVAPAPAADPEQGLVIIRGSSAKTIALSDSYSTSFTVNYASKETSRTVDIARVYQQEEAPSGGGGATGVNKDNYVDVELAKHFKMRDLGGGAYEYYYTPVKESSNVEVLQRDVTRKP